MQTNSPENIHSVSMVSSGVFEETDKKNIPAPEDYDQLVSDHALLESTKTLGLRVRLPSPSKPIIYVVRPDVIDDVLRDNVSFGLGNYDEAFSDLNFVLSDDETQYALKRKLIGKIFKHRDHSASIADLQISDLAYEISSQISQILMLNTKQKGEFDIIRDYGSMVIYLVSCRAFGLRGNRKSIAVVRLLRTLRAAFSFRRFNLTPVSREMQNMLTTCQLFFAQLFLNFRNKNTGLAWVGKSVARQLQKDCSDALSKREQLPPSCFAAQLIDAKRSIDNESGNTHTIGETQKAIEELLLEFVTTLIMIVNVGFVGVLKSIESSNISLTEASKRAAEPDTGSKFVNEALRINSPTATVYRRAKEDCVLGNAHISKGEDLILLIKQASLYEGRFPEPTKLNTDQQDSKYLHFGPYEGVHACLGQNWAKEIIRQMLIALSGFDSVRFKEDPKLFFGTPESWTVGFKPQSGSRGPYDR